MAWPYQDSPEALITLKTKSGSILNNRAAFWRYKLRAMCFCRISALPAGLDF